MNKASDWYQYIAPTLLLYALFSALPCLATDAPSDSLKAFYQHVVKKECEEALELRPDYSLQRCEKISNVHIHKVTTELSDNKNAVLLLELDSFYNKKKSYFFGYVRMTKKNNKWLIIGPFKSKEDYWLDEYVQSYIPGKFKGLPESVKKKKFIPPPSPSKLSKQTPQEEIPSNEEIAPPGDSIDADEFIPQSTNKTPKKTVSKRQPNVQNSTITTNPDIDKFLNGDYPIQGNYTTLLTKIRKNFPADANATILLIDKSRRTMYLYNAQNLLLAFFPILSSDNSNFPSGLYKLNQDKPVESEVDTGLQVSQPIILNRILKQKMKNTPLFYIRDLFDTNTKNSLQLSPVDANKLQQLLSSPTISYIGQ